ncbi:MAG TPA: outer membrane beta-barrel protein [Casimicrobiaceae bacterium]|nr:outer membrane beta-barrel protein [Casimicrobiaceae bacterium]
MRNQPLAQLAFGALTIGLAAAASANGGFYGGVSMRDNGAESKGLTLAAPAGGQTLIWNRFAPPAVDESTQRSLVYGGYRWKNDVAVEATFNSSDKYALRPAPSSLSIGPGLGLSLGDVSAHAWNADVYTSWEFLRSLSLYGRLGYAQSEARPLFAGASLVPGDPRRQRDGVNYGVGLRYDVTHSLGLRVEYARFGRFAGELIGNGMPDSDQVSIGVQYRF